MGKIKNLIEKQYIYCLVFIAAPLVLLIVYALRGVYPFGSGSVLVLDLNAQYIYYYEVFREVFFENKSLFYSFSRTLGGNMIGDYAYYLASPFSFVLLLFPKNLITEAILCIILLKVGASALTFAIYLKQSRKAHPTSIFLFSMMYALMSYIIVQTMNPMWLDGPILFPLIILSIERFINRGRFKLLVVSLTAMFVSNFYIGYMVGIFAFIYFIYYIYSSDNGLYWKTKSRTFIKFLGFSLISLGGAMWLLLPTYYALTMGKFGFSQPDYFPKQQLDIFDLFSKMLPLAYDSVNYHGLPFIYCGLLTLLLTVIYFSSEKISFQNKYYSSALLLIFITAMMVSTLDIALHGFQGPNWLPFRYSFMLSFFILTIAFEAYESIQFIKPAVLLKACLALLFLTAFIGRLYYAFIQPVQTLWLTYVLLILYSVLLYVYKISISEHTQYFICLKRFIIPYSRAFKIILLAVVILELFLNTFVLIESADKEVHYSDRNSYRNYFERLYPAVDLIKQTDSSFYRIETVMRRTVNDPMALGIYGLSHSSSILDSNVIDLMYKLGFSAREHWTRYKGATPVSDSIFGLRYILSESKINNLYEPIASENGITIYHNPYALPLVITVEKDFIDLEMDSYDPFVNQNRLLSALLGLPDEEFFKMVSIEEVVFENMNSTVQNSMVSYNAIDPAKNAHIEYILASAGDNEIYMYLVSDYPRKVNLWLNGEFLDTFFDYESTCIMPLGSHPETEKLSLITTPTEGEYHLNHNMFYYLDTPLFMDKISRLYGNAAVVEKLSERKLRITVRAEADEILFTTIPYDPGWQVTNNGKTAETYEVLGSLLAIKLNPGEQVINLSYIPRGLLTGIFISFFSGLIFCILLFIRHRRNKLR